MLSFEACIACGFIHSNSRYADLFASSVGTSAEITDKDFNIRYAALNTAPISKETMREAEQGSVTVDGGLTVHTMPIGGGYAVWTEDVSALLAIKEESESLAEELADRNEILRYEWPLWKNTRGKRKTVRISTTPAWRAMRAACR